MSTAGRAGRGGLAVAGVSGLAAAFLVGTVVGGQTTTVAPPIGPSDTAPVRLVNADLTLPGSCDALLGSYVERGVERVGPWGWGWGNQVVYAQGVPLAAADDSVAGAAVPSSGVVEQGSSATGTNVQEVGVDEPDLVKTDGELLVRVSDDELELHDLTGRAPVEVSDVDLPGTDLTLELLLAGDTVVVLGTEEPDGDAARGTTRLTTYDVSDPTAPTLVDDRSFGAGVVRAVQHDDTIRLVLSTGLPELDFVEPRFWRDEEDALERNQDTVRESSIEDWLPTVTTYDAEGAETGTEQLLDCDRITVPSAESAALGTMAVIGFDADSPATPDVMGVATDTVLAYVSPTRMYLASSAYSAWGCCWLPEIPGPTSSEDAGRTRIYGFELDGTSATYTASGVVDGVVADRWAMDEHDGVLRLAVGESQETGNFSSVLTLREDGDELEEVGRVDKLGVNEEIKAVRWFDGLAIVVTFRQTDPLYAVDLTDADAPRLLGQLKIPGFSEYLHPISGQRLIGLGQDALTSGRLLGAQAALFDVSDLTAPRRTDTVGYSRGSVAAAAADPRQFTWLPEQDTALAVVSEGWEGRTGWVSVLTVSGGSLANRMVEVEYGTDVDDVRLVPLPDGRVVLMTAADVSFFEV